MKTTLNHVWAVIKSVITAGPASDKDILWVRKELSNYKNSHRFFKLF